VLDSTCDLPPAEVRCPNWRVVPLYVHFGEQVYRDHVELDTATFYRRLLESPELPHSSQPSPGDFGACFDELENYERVLALTVSSKLSGTFDSARIAAELAEPGRVLLVDGGTVSGGTLLLAEAFQRRLERGTTEAELLALVERFREASAFVFTVATLEYLVRGGRVGRAAGLAGQLLSAKPVLRIADGEIQPVGRVRGRARALAEVRRVLLDETEEDAPLRLAVAHADAPEDAGALAESVLQSRPRATVDVRVTFGPVIGTNTGPGAVALAWFADEL
jgi:DegV family protein with EDD domain